MSFVPLRNFGRLGVIHDTPAESLPIGAWSDARNVRFTGLQIEKMLEPTLESSFTAEAVYQFDGPAQWFEGWSDGESSYVVVATQQNLWFLSRGDADDAGTWTLATREETYTPAGASTHAPGDLTYSVDGHWQSFGWGDTVIFNNGIDPPQILDPKSLKFSDLPNWGFISTSNDILNDLDPSKYTAASCTCIVPVKNFLVACGITESGEYSPNTIWWSDATSLATFERNDTGAGPPSWDYESPSTLSGKLEIDPQSGAITTAALLNDNLIIYTEGSATALTVVGGSFVMSARRLFNKGAAGLHCVAEFNNFHYVVASDQLYIHDGSTVKLIAKDRVEEEFFKRAGKGGRYGGGSVDFQKIQVVKNPDRKEICIVYDTPAASTPPVEDPLVLTGPTNVSVLAGEDATLGLTASGGTSPYTYAWEQNTFGVWQVIATDDPGFTGADAANLTAIFVPVEMSGTQYRCRVTDSGGLSQYSGTATLVVS